MLTVNMAPVAFTVATYAAASIPYVPTGFVPNTISSPTLYPDPAEVTSILPTELKVLISKLFDLNKKYIETFKYN